MTNAALAAAPSSGTHSRQDIDRTFRKVTLRVVPLTLIAYVVAYIDRMNVGFAKLQFMHDLHFSEAVYGLGAGLFFVGYMLFEVPSNLFLEKVGARATLARIMVLWGLVSACMALVSTPLQFYIGRFLLGAAEAGLFPGVILYLSYWFPAARRARITSLFVMGGAVAGIVGSLVSGWLLTFDGLFGLKGWQVLFVFEGLPAVLLGIVAWLAMDDKPERARWLTERERQIVLHNLQADRKAREASPQQSLWRAIRDPMVVVLAITYIAVISATSTIGLWAPSVLKSVGVGAHYVGIATGGPFVVAVACMYLLGLNSDRTLERRWHFAGAIAAGGIGFAILGIGAGSPAITIAVITLIAAGAWSSVVVFWTIPTAYLPDSVKAGGLAFVSSVGGVGGFISPTIVGTVASKTGSLYYGLAVVGAMLVASAVLVVVAIRPETLKERREV